MLPLILLESSVIEISVEKTVTTLLALATAAEVASVTRVIVPCCCNAKYSQMPMPRKCFL